MLRPEAERSCPPHPSWWWESAGLPPPGCGLLGTSRSCFPYVSPGWHGGPQWGYFNEMQRSLGRGPQKGGSFLGALRQVTNPLRASVSSSVTEGGKHASPPLSHLRGQLSVPPEAAQCRPGLDSTCPPRPSIRSSCCLSLLLKSSCPLSNILS